MATNNASESNTSNNGTETLTANNGTGSTTTSNGSEFKFISLGYYLSIIVMKNKINSFIFDILIVSLCYIYFTTCSYLNFEIKYGII